MRRWRREGGDGKEYRIKKKEYALLCEGKRGRRWKSGRRRWRR